MSGDVHTQTIEGFFSNLKSGIAGTYHSVSSKWLQSYLKRVRLALLRARTDQPVDVQPLLARASE